MRINIYQINADRDTDHARFEGYEQTLKNGGIDSASYKCVFHGYVNAKDLDDVYNIFNGFRASNVGTYQGHSLSVSDVVEAVDDIPEVYGKIDFFMPEKIMSERSVKRSITQTRTLTTPSSRNRGIAAAPSMRKSLRTGI